MKFCVDCRWCFEEDQRRWELEKYQCKNPKMCYTDPVTGKVRETAGFCYALRQSQDVHDCGLEACFYEEININNYK